MSSEKQISEKEQAFLSDCEEFISSSLRFAPDADKNVLDFIAHVALHSGKEHSDIILHLFEGGYCYYFAKMLEHAFRRGCVCLCYPYGHFVWVDYDGKTANWIPYDISGVSFAEADEYLPVALIPEIIPDFLHVKGVNSPNNIRAIADEFVQQHPEELFRKGQIPEFLLK